MRWTFNGKRRAALWHAQDRQLVGLSLLALVMSIIGLFMPSLMPVAAYSVPITLGAFFLNLRRLLVLYSMLGACIAFVSVNRVFTPTIGHFFVIGLTAILGLAFALSRRDLGLQGRASDTMLIDLRNRLTAQGTIPKLQGPWTAETQLSPAKWERFSGDFLVAKAVDGHWLRLCIVDVSGKGAAAATRSLSLSGAYGGLLSAIPSDRFLPAANEYLISQSWDEGFATAAYLDLNLSNGLYELRSAGHPPAVHYHAANGTWTVLDKNCGPALGLAADFDYDAQRGVVKPGDALLLYTDGLVEERGVDVEDGIAHLVHVATSEMRHQKAGCAERIVRRVGAADDDDRTVAVVRRAPVPKTSRGRRPAWPATENPQPSDPTFIPSTTNRFSALAGPEVTPAEDHARAGSGGQQPPGARD